MSKITHWTQYLPEAGKQIDMQVMYINQKLEQINNHLACIERLDKERVEAETRLIEEVDQHFTEEEINAAKDAFDLLMIEKEVANGGLLFDLHEHRHSMQKPTRERCL